MIIVWVLLPKSKKCHNENMEKKISELTKLFE